MVRPRSHPRYDDDLLDRFGERSADGVKVALDLGGGAAIVHAPSILARLGCEVTSLNDTPGVFNRTIDPVSDPLTLLQKVVNRKECDIGLAFDCDGDRLVILDSEGRKRSGDFMLALAFAQILPTLKAKKVVVSVDTTQAVDELVEGFGGKVSRSKVGEAKRLLATRSGVITERWMAHQATWVSARARAKREERVMDSRPASAQVWL